MACITFGRSRLQRGKLKRHRHAVPYLAVVLAGRYSEAGDCGCHVVGPGDVLVHERFDAHMNDLLSSSVELINLPIPRGASLPCAGRVDDPDTIARLCESDLLSASRSVVDAFIPSDSQPTGWPAVLASQLKRLPSTNLGEWAEEHGLARATISRGFKAVFGVSPSRYRAEQRTRQACAVLENSAVPLAELAAELGYADQSHMTRAVREMTDRPPSFWRTIRQTSSRPPGSS
ncbi:MAG: AraC family transcriptional regulator [Myxococcota bacterium]